MSCNFRNSNNLYKSEKLLVCMSVYMYIHLQLGNERSNCLKIFRVAVGGPRDIFRCKKIRESW